MNFLKIEDSCAIIKFSNSDTSSHKNIMFDMDTLMQCGFSCFIFDFSGVSSFSSSVLGFTLGMIRILKNSDRKIFVRNLSEEARQMISYSVKVENQSDDLKDFLSLENTQNIELGGRDG